MTKDKALKMAIAIFEFSGARDSEAYWQMVEVAKNACKEALEQPAQEPVIIGVDFAENILKK